MLSDSVITRRVDRSIFRDQAHRLVANFSLFLWRALDLSYPFLKPHRQTANEKPEKQILAEDVRVYCGFYT